MMVVEFLEGVKECPKDILGPHVLRVQGPPAGADAAVHKEPEIQAKYTFSLFNQSF